MLERQKIISHKSNSFKKIAKQNESNKKMQYFKTFGDNRENIEK